VGDAGETVLAVFAGYLVGTFPTAELVTRLATHGRVDIRAVGSGNPGGLNTMQTVGKAWGALVILIDIVKGVVAGLVGWAIADEPGAYGAATAAIAGHIAPVWSRFRGGKGVATSGGAVLVTFPAYFPVEVAVAAFGALSTRNSERAVLLTAPVWIGAAFAWWLADLPDAWGPEPSVGLPIAAVASVAMVLTKFRLSRG